jgi:hypothetical protein
MHVKLYEDIARFGHIATSYAYPVKVNARYVMDPSPTPKFDNPKMHMPGAAAVRRRPREAHLCDPALHRGVSLDFEDHPFEALQAQGLLRAVRVEDSYLDEMIVTDDKGSRMFVCSDTDYCETRQSGASRHARMLRPMRRAQMLASEFNCPMNKRSCCYPLLVAAKLHAGQSYGRLGMPRCVLRTLFRRGAGGRRRIRLRQIHTAAIAGRPVSADHRASVSYRMHDGVPAISRAGRSRAALPVSHRLGLCASACPAMGLRMASRPAPMSASG